MDFELIKGKLFCDTMEKSIIREKSFDFALEIIKLYKQLRNQKEYVISEQLLRSATSVGANVVEAEAAQSKRTLYPRCS